MTTSSDKGDVSRLLTEIAGKAAAIRTADLGYPPGENHVLPPAPSDDMSFINDDLPNAASVKAFYQLSDGIALPDVGNGIFLHTRRQVVTSAQRGLPHALREGGPIFVFGTDGGGGVACEHGEPADVVVECERAVMSLLTELGKFLWRPILQ